jgi:tRNA(Arg) A34 adenosine deaminase TadA
VRVWIDDAEIVAIRRACALLGAFNLPDCDI